MESGKPFFVESWILGFGIWDNGERIWNPATKDRNSESNFYWQRLESSTFIPESKAWDPESKTALDSLTWGEPI